MTISASLIVEDGKHLYDGSSLKMGRRKVNSAQIHGLGVSENLQMEIKGRQNRVNCVVGIHICGFLTLLDV